MSKKGIGRLLAAVLALLLAMSAASSLGEEACKVYFHLNYKGAPEGASQTVEAGGTVSAPAEPAREGYRFTGWYTNVVCNQPYDFSAPVTESLRLFAGWEATFASVTFRLQDGAGQDQTVQVSMGDTVQQPADPARSGYEFGGWFTNAAGTRPFDFSAPLTEESITVYARWIQEQATVTYVLFGEEQTVAKTDFDKPLQRPEDPVREDYAFDGWYTAVAGTEAYDFSAPVTADVRIYAHWVQTAATLTLESGYEGAPVQTRKVQVGEAAGELPVPEREGYTFTDWYVDAAASAPYDRTAPVSGDITLYAGWALKEYSVTFRSNDGTDAASEAAVLFGQSVSLPSDPVRSGFDFTGWYLDEAATQMFNASSAVTGDMTLYAGWQSQAEASGDRIYTYLLNYDDQGVYETQTFTSTRRVKAPDAPVRPGYYFAGWAKDAEGTDLYDFSSERSAASMTLHAKWLKGFTFEAEYTDLEGKPGQGSSDNCMGVDLIQSPKDVLGNGTQMGMSNGFYVGKLYYNGAFLAFSITASEEITDGVLVARLTPDLFDMRFTDETWQVLVNGERLEYGRLNLVGAVAQTDFDEYGNAINGDMNKRPFENYVLTTALHLQAGENEIRLVTNNKQDHGGTFNAETPLIDCLYIYTNADVQWTVCHPENVKQTMDDVNYTVTYDTGA